MQRSLPCPWSAYLMVLGAAGVLYGVSCAPGALWQDSGLIQYRVWHNDIEGFLGLAISHPLYYIVAIGTNVLPIGTFGHRVNLVSAIAGAVAIANLYLLMRLWLGRNFPAVIAAMTLAVSHTFWRHASIAETYTFWTALFLGELIVLLQYGRTKRIGYLYALGLLNGLALAVHMLAVIPALCYAVLLTVLLGKRAMRWKEVALVVLFWVVGALPYECLIVREMIQSGDILGTLASAAFGERWQNHVLNTRLSWPIVRENVSFLLLNFPTLQDESASGVSISHRGTAGAVLRLRLPLHGLGSLRLLHSLLRGRIRHRRARGPSRARACPAQGAARSHRGFLIVSDGGLCHGTGLGDTNERCWRRCPPMRSSTPIRRLSRRCCTPRRSRGSDRTCGSSRA